LDGSGTIDANELGLMFASLGQGTNPTKLKQMITEATGGTNNDLSWLNFLTIMRKVYPWKYDEFLKKYYEPAKKFTQFKKEDIDTFVASFREFDLDCSGTIDINELSRAFEMMGQGCNPTRLQQIITTYSADGKGIAWIGFLQVMADMYSSKIPEGKPPTQQPLKQTTTTTTPASPKLVPAKSATSMVGTSTKQTTPSSPVTPQKATTPSSPSTTQKTTFTAAKPQLPTTGSSVSLYGGAKPGIARGSSSISLGSGRSNGCASCGKAVYPIEAINAVEKIWHKGCFKCSDCSITLSLKTFTGSAGKVYCNKHAPKDKPIALGAHGSIATKIAMSAPKVQKAQGVNKTTRLSFAPNQLKRMMEEAAANSQKK